MKSSKRIVTQPKEYLAEYVCNVIESQGYGSGYAPEGNYETIGYAKGDELIAAVLYTDFKKDSDSFNHCTMGIAATGKLWATPEFLRAIFYYPFTQLGCRRVNAMVASNNMPSIKTVEHAGFTLDATLERGWPGCDLLIYGMFPENCRYLK